MSPEVGGRAPVPAAGRPGRLDRQRHVRHRHDDRRRHRAAPHRRGDGRPAQHRIQPSAHLRRRGDGPALRLPRPDVLARHRGELAADPGATADGGLGAADVPGHQGGPAIGRRQSVVIVAEGAQDRDGNPITADQVRTLLEERTRRGRPDHHPGPRAAWRRAERLRQIPGDAARPRRRRTTAHRRPEGAAPTDRAAGKPGRHLAVDGLCGADPGRRRADQGAGLRRGNAVARRQLPRSPTRSCRPSSRPRRDPPRRPGAVSGLPWCMAAGPHRG